MFRTLGSVLVIAALAAPQPTTAQPLVEGTQPARARMGAFAGARLRLPLGGMRRDPVRAGLTLTSMRMLDGDEGQRRAAFGEGLEFGLSGGQRPAWSLAGQPLSGPAARRNMTAAGKVALVAGGLLLVGGITFLVLLREAERNSD